MIRAAWVRATAELGRFVLRAWPAPLGKRFVFRVINRLNSRLGVELEGQTRWGGRFVCSLRDLVQARIYYTGVWEPSLTALVESRLMPGDLFVDVGANVGYFTVLAARVVGPTGRVVAVEASPGVHRRLTRNIALNALTNVRALNVAAAEAPGVLEVYAADETNVGSTSLLADRGGNLEARVEALPVRDILDGDLAAARFIKIDVEGFEGPVLRHLLHHVDELHPEVTIVAELSPAALGKFGMSTESLLGEFASRGFELSLLDNDYEWTGWYDTAPRAPAPMITVPQAQVDVVFSRRAAGRTPQAGRSHAPPAAPDGGANSRR